MTFCHLNYSSLRLRCVFVVSSFNTRRKILENIIFYRQIVRDSNSVMERNTIR